MAQLTTEAVWSRLSSDLRRFIRRRVPDDHVTDDLLQESFVRIHRSLPTLQDDQRLAAWVYQIARHAIGDHFRRKSPHEPLPDAEVADDCADPLAEIRCQAGEWLPELIGQLPDTYRQAVTLAEIDGLTHQEVADRLGLSLSAAKSRVHRGREALRDILNQCCNFQLDHAGRVTDCDPRSDRKVCRKCEE